MGNAINLIHNGRFLQIKASVIGGDWQIWFYEGGKRIYLHSVLPHDQTLGVEHALMQAQRDLETNAIVIPVVRVWPTVRPTENESTPPADRPLS